MKQLLDEVIGIAVQAGEAVMQIYNGGNDIGVKQKDDSSPLTKADMASHNMIEAALQRTSKYPVISEEGGHDADNAEKFWLVDPLDGTKEFINRNGEFTINIALIEKSEPVLGVVNAPAKNVLYAAAKGVGAFKQIGGKRQAIRAVFGHGKPKIVASRSHKDSDTAEFLKNIGPYDLVNMGSSLKLCLVAEGAAMCYPRFAPTYGWDTAAADAVVRLAGGSVRNPQGGLLGYKPGAVKNPFFIVRTKDCWY